MCREVQRCYGQAMGGSTLKIDTAVMVCTLEKANLVVNRMLEEGTLGMLSCVVVDEVIFCFLFIIQIWGNACGGECGVLMGGKEAASAAWKGCTYGKGAVCRRFG